MGDVPCQPTATLGPSQEASLTLQRQLYEELRHKRDQGLRFFTQSMGLCALAVGFGATQWASAEEGSASIAPLLASLGCVALGIGLFATVTLHFMLQSYLGIARRIVLVQDALRLYGAVLVTEDKDWGAPEGGRGFGRKWWIALPGEAFLGALLASGLLLALAWLAPR